MRAFGVLWLVLLLTIGAGAAERKGGRQGPVHSVCGALLGKVEELGFRLLAVSEQPKLVVLMAPYAELIDRAEISLAELRDVGARRKLFEAHELDMTLRYVGTLDEGEALLFFPNVTLSDVTVSTPAIDGAILREGEVQVAFSAKKIGARNWDKLRTRLRSGIEGIGAFEQWSQWNQFARVQIPGSLDDGTKDTNRVNWLNLVGLILGRFFDEKLDPKIRVRLVVALGRNRPFTV